MTFWERYELLCTEKGIPPSGIQMQKVTKVSSAGITKWKKGSKPNFETLTRLAKYFNVDIRYLIGMTESRQGEDVIEKATDLLLNSCDNIETFDDDNGIGQEYVITYEGKSYNLQDHEYKSLCHELITVLNETELFAIQMFCQSKFRS